MLETMRPRSVAFACLLAAPAALGQGTSVHLGGDAGVAYDSNVGNTPTSGPVQSSSVETLGGHADVFTPLTLFTSLLVRGSLDGEIYNAATKLSNAKGTLMARLFWRPGGDFFTPMLALWGSGAYARYGSSIRDGAEYRGGAYVAEQVTTAINVRLEGVLSRRNANAGVFNLNNRSLGLSLDWVLPAAVTAYGGYQFRRGDIATTTACGSGPYAPGSGSSDDGFVGEVDCVYKLDANTRIATLGVNVPLSSAWSFDLQGQYVKSSGDSGVDYTRWLTYASVLARF